ncbi:zinc finger protein Noc [Bacillus rossius redtenbacheri]|uniref:zinc finger protein Noc n=1 Tax=Bacillus rossius redtenbacheri TaxID=93214 RepID=UPI002FDE7CFB
MVVLEGGGGMLTTGSNQYLQPDYLSPLPTTLDAKKSPLALLAQTCSQIGADSPSAKPLIPALEKPSKKSGGGGDAASSPPAHKADKAPAPPPRASPPEPRLAFKPYEANVLTKKSPEPRPPSKANSAHNDEDKKSSPPSRASSRKSASPQATTPAPADKAPPAADKPASPIVRSGLEVLQGHPKDLPLGASPSYKPLGLGALCSGCPPGLDPANPAFRPPFAGAFSHHHAAMLAAAGYPTAPAATPYVSYARVKTASGGEALVPVCKDPYCAGCQFSVHHQQLAAASCPSGCTQCDHQKYGLAAALSGLVPPPLGYPHLARPYVCNWIAGDSYCGKRFAASDELLQHLRTHTSLSADAAAAAAAAAASPMSLLAPHSFLHRAYPNPPLSPLSASRYHPYSKPGLPASLAASPFSAFNPTALGPYYSPYSLYGQRIGAAVHQ